MNDAWRQLVVATHCLLLAGCATTQVQVDALAKPKAEESISYQLSDLNPSAIVDSRRYSAVGPSFAVPSGDSRPHSQKRMAANPESLHRRWKPN